MARLPVVYLPHGGGPWPFVSLGQPPGEVAAMRAYLEGLPAQAEGAKALLLVSAHWEASVPTVMTHSAPPMLFDYSGFPPAAYRLSWPAPGSPALAARVQALLGAAGIPSAADPSRGFDHGAFVPMMLSWPRADLPAIQLSLKRGLDPAEHLAIGRALAPLREEGVFIVGSGSSFHNMQLFGDPRAANVAATFDHWLTESVPLPAPERDARLRAWATAPAGRLAHPREEHLLPLIVVAGAAGEDRGRLGWGGPFMGAQMSAWHFG